MFCTSRKATGIALAVGVFVIHLTPIAQLPIQRAPMSSTPLEKNIDPILVDPLPLPIKIGNSSLSCTLAANTTNASTYEISYKVANTGKTTLLSWQVQLPFAQPPRIIKVANAETRGSPTVTASNTASNGTLKPGQSTQFTLAGYHNGYFVPPAVSPTRPLAPLQAPRPAAVQALALLVQAQVLAPRVLAPVPAQAAHRPALAAW